MRKNESFFINPVKRSFRRIVSRQAEEAERALAEAEPAPGNSDASPESAAPPQENPVGGAEAPPPESPMKDIFDPWNASAGEGGEGESDTPVSPAATTDSTASEAAAMANRVIATGTPRPPIDESDIEAEDAPGEALEDVTNSLADIFEKKVVVNRRVKALLGRYPAVDGRALADELREFARSIGATDDGG